jgi:regulation of enolase protein 1 (concanavalin A-like superfamily)
VKTILFPGLPAPLSWKNQPTDWRIDGQELSITAGPRTDLFSDPAGTPPIANSPALMMPVAGDFTLHARVRVDFRATFDAGVLLVHAGSDRWGKLCFEYTPQGEPMVVSVVNRGVSDDCNSTLIDGNQAFLRIARLGDAWAFHYSLDGAYWHLVRYFSLGALDEVAVGFSAQSPTGRGCRVDFGDIRFAARRLLELRSGV